MYGFFNKYIIPYTMLSDKDLKTQLAQALGSFTGEGYNCICNSSSKADCICAADWSTKKELLLERKLDVAVNALIEATTELYKFGSATDNEFQKKNNLSQIIDKYDNLADELEDLSNPLDSLL